MTGFGYGGDQKSMEERRRQRMEEARRRVESGEHTPPPPPAARPTRSSSTRTAKPTTVDPLAVVGAQYAVWRSVQHFCTTDSLPDARGANLDLLVAWSDSIQPFRLRQRIVARLDSQGAWLPVCYAKDGARESITQAQAERYRDARLGETTMSGGAQRPLKETDHPEATQEL